MPDWLKYDYATDTVEIFGIRYTSDLFRGAAFGPIGSAFRIESRSDGVVQLTRLPAPDPRQAAIELAYGLLWLVPNDASPRGRRIKLARATLFGQLDREARLRGLKAAQDALAADAAPADPTPRPPPCRSANGICHFKHCMHCGAVVGQECQYEAVMRRAERLAKPRTKPRTHVGIIASDLNGKEI